MKKQMIVEDEVEASELLTQIREVQEKIEDSKRRLAEEISELKMCFDMEIGPLHDFVKEATEALLDFAEKNRAELTEGGKRKTIALSTGTISWRKTPPSVHIRNVEKILESLRLLGLSRFIRTVEVPDKEAMLKEPEVAKTISGVTITQSEVFVVKPEGGKEVTIRLSKRRVV